LKHSNDNSPPIAIDSEYIGKAFPTSLEFFNVEGYLR
jgi:hypothetical protein